MASTKIINVLKDDSFKEILELFKATPAEEVIFVLPKRSKAFQKEEHFSELKKETKQLGKAVSFLCSNAELNEMAKKYGFDVLLTRSSSPVRKSGTPRSESGSISMVNEIEDFYEQTPAPVVQPKPVPEPSRPEVPDEQAIDEQPADDGGQDEEDEIEAPAAPSRKMQDIVQVDYDKKRDVKISAVREKRAPIDVHHDFKSEALERRALDEIKTVWQSGTSVMPAKKAIPSFWSSWPGPKLSVKKFTPKNGYHRTMVGFGAVALVLFGVVIYISTGTAEITIKPQSEPLDLKLNVTAADTVSSVSVGDLKIPGQLFTIEKKVSQDFHATGSQDVAQKARGIITAYNKTSAAQQLVATTRFESADHHIFHTLQGVIVPAAKNSTVPGKVIIQVIADKAGQDFNIAAGTFTIPAFHEKGDAVKYENIYGQSDAAMHGGTSGKASVVAAGDYSQAKDTLTDRLKTSVSDELKSEIAGLKVIGDSQVNVDKVDSTAAVDDAADTFTMNIAGSLKTVGFKESDLQGLISQYVDAKYSLVARADSLAVEYQNIQFNPITNALSFTVSVKGPGFKKIDQERLISDLIGKNGTQIRDYLKGLPDVASANVLLSPLWVRSIPHDRSRVHIILSY